MMVYLTNNNESEDFTMQYRTILDKVSLQNVLSQYSLALVALSHNPVNGSM